MSAFRFISYLAVVITFMLLLRKKFFSYLLKTSVGIDLCIITRPNFMIWSPNLSLVPFLIVLSPSWSMSALSLLR